MENICSRATSGIHDWSGTQVADFYTEKERPVLSVCCNCDTIDDKEYVGQMVTFDFLKTAILYEEGRILT